MRASDGWIYVYGTQSKVDGEIGLRRDITLYIEDIIGNEWIIYHAIPCKDFIGRQKRVMLINGIVYIDGWARIKFNHPSDTINTGPIFLPEEEQKIYYNVKDNIICGVTHCMQWLI